jgi:hypothetical protein
MVQILLLNEELETWNDKVIDDDDDVGGYSLGHVA